MLGWDLQRYFFVVRDAGYDFSSEQRLGVIPNLQFLDSQHLQVILIIVDRVRNVLDQLINLSPFELPLNRMISTARWKAWRVNYILDMILCTDSTKTGEG